jgi:nucleoside-diphosphate-sugar epimerase
LTCNIASGSRTSLKDLLRAVCVAAGRDVEPVLGSPRLGDIPHSYADVSLAREAIGFDPATRLNDGIALSVESFGRRLGQLG